MAGSKTITDKEKSYMNDKFFQLLDQIYKLKDDNGNEFSYAFHALPLRANLEYYKVIKAPMSYSKIKMASKHKRYTHPQAFINDLAQITWNARFFNEESSEFFKFALILDNFIKNEVIPNLQKDPKIYKNNEIFYPNLGVLPSDVNNETTQSKNLVSTNQTIDVADIKIPTSPVKQKQPLPNSLKHPTENSTPTPEDEEEEEEHDHEHDHEHDETKHEDEFKSLIPHSYNPTSYVATIEDTGKSHVFNPPKSILNHTPDRHILEQWVKRGRPPIVDKPHEQKIKSIMRGLKKIKIGSKTLVSFWDKLPSQQDHPDYLKVVKEPISMLDIKSLIKQRYYKTVDAYVADVFKLINNNRNYFVHDDFIKNNLDILETNISRLYQIEMSKPDVDYMSGQQVNKFPLNQVVHDGRTYKVGNWILINNPNDALRPTVAQIFRLWQQDDGELCMNVCWYYRPEWTVHRIDRLFLDNEVVKTGQYRDHFVSEIVGPCYVAYFTRWLKGDPGVKFEGPLFICEFRYNDRENTFAKIRTWKACLPDEVRHLEDPIKPITYNRVLKKYPSPIKQLLAPGSTPTSPIPQPIIISLNAPPVVGAVYLPRLNDENDPHYFDNTLTDSQCKSYVPPTTNIRIPSSALVDNNQNHDETESSNTTTTSNTITGNVATNDVDNVVNSLINTTQFMTSIQSNVINNGHNNNIITSSSSSNLKKSSHNNSLSSMSSFKAYNTKQPSMNVTYPGSHKIIKSPYNLGTYSYSQFHSPSSSFTFVRYNGQEENLPNMVKSSYACIDKHNCDRVNSIFKQHQLNINLNGSTSSNYVEKDSIIWFRSPPLKIVDRILGNDEDENSSKVGVKRVRCGHSAEYIAWKLKKQKQEQGQEQEQQLN